MFGNQQLKKIHKMRWSEEQAQSEQWNCNIKDLNIHSFIAVILICVEFHGNYLTIWQPKLSRMSASLVQKYVFIFVLLAKNLFVTEFILNNFLMVILGINVETSFSSWYWGQTKNSRVSANWRLTKINLPRKQVALFRSQEVQQHDILSITGTHFTLNPMAMT